VISIITFLAIAGTLSSCGRYGKPVRVAPATDTTDLAAEDEDAAVADAKRVDESSDESRETEEIEETDSYK
jgi:hypothetical protein